jgi:hypothetical protein
MDGKTVFEDIPEGRYVLVEEIAPDGFRPSAEKKVTVRSGKIRTLTVPHRG